jgi:chemotaxis protein histidine kinase CheA
MASRKEQPLVATYADHEVITPPHKLAKAVAKVSLPGDDPIGRAEAALKQLSSEFAAWMYEECDRLDAARRDVRDGGFSKKNIDALFHAVHDIKGEAATFGYPAVAPAAESLCRVIEHTPDTTRIPVALVDQHVDAIRAIVREYARPDVGEIAKALTTKLRTVSDEFLARENAHRPDYIRDILAPSIAPGESL